MGRILVFWMPLVLVFVGYAVDVPLNGVYEHPVSHTSGAYENPWIVEMPVTLTSPSGTVYSIGGFFYEEDTWMFRFAPKEVGEWTFSLAIDGTEETGTFTCVGSENPEFLRLSPYNPRRFTYNSGAPFYVLGVQDCLEQDEYDNNGIDKNNWSVNGRKDLTFSEYLDVMRSAGFNLWRLNANNCAFHLNEKLHKDKIPYREENGKIFDQYAKMLKEKGFAVYLCIFGMSFPWQKDSVQAPENMEKLRNFLSFVVNRYGAYTDIWELGNEVRSKTYQDTLLQIMAEHIRTVDPHAKPISTSYARAELEYIDIASPHGYINTTPDKFDRWPRGRLEEYGEYNKPIVYGELGNSGTCPYDTMPDFPHAAHEDRWRVTLWTMFFSEVIPIFWHTESRKYCGPGPKNFHLDTISMKYLQILTGWQKGFDPGAQVVPDLIETSSSDVRGYALSGERNYAVYLYDWAGYASTRSGLSITINPSDVGTGDWMDPKTGDVLSSIVVETEGPQSISVPDFKADAVLKMTLGSTSERNRGIHGPGIPHSRQRITPKAPVYSILGKRLPENSILAPGVYISGKESTGAGSRVLVNPMR